MLFTFILVGFKIQDNLAFSYPEICYGDKCYDEPKDCSFLKWSLCETDDECGDFKDGFCSYFTPPDLPPDLPGDNRKPRKK